MKKVRLSSLINSECLQHGFAALAAFVDLPTLATKYPKVAEHLGVEAEYRGKPLSWALETARAYLEGKLNELAKKAGELEQSETLQRLFGQVDELTRRTQELEARIAAGAPQ